jgi:hypothetical protein
MWARSLSLREVRDTQRARSLSIALSWLYRAEFAHFNERAR